MFIKSPSSNTRVRPNRRAPADSKKKLLRIPLSAPGKSTVATAVKPAATPLVKIAPGKVILWSVILGFLGFLYITHVFNTQETLQEVNQIRMEYDRVRAIHEDRSMIYYRMTGPAEIYSRAKQQGFIDRNPRDSVIEIRR